MILAASQNWFRDLQPWIDFDYAQSALFDGALNGQQWAHLGVTGLIWLVIPLTIGLGSVIRAEIK
jgi:ABC-2 type transport system permease protein